MIMDVIYNSFRFTLFFFLFCFTDPAPTEIYTLSLHDALPILPVDEVRTGDWSHLRSLRLAIEVLSPSTTRADRFEAPPRSEEHTSELQSPYDLVCRLLLEKKNKNENLQVGRHSVKYSDASHDT